MRDVETMSARLSNANGCDIRIGQETWSSGAILNLSHTFPWGFLDMQCTHYTKKFVFTIVPGKHNWFVFRSANRGWSAATHGTSLGFVYLSAFTLLLKNASQILFIEGSSPLRLFSSTVDESPTSTFWVADEITGASLSTGLKFH